MSEHVVLPGVGNKFDGWDFSKTAGFPAGFALSGAELAISMLKNPVKSHRNVAWLTVRHSLSVLNEFAEFAATKGCYRFSDVTQSLLSNYLHVLMHGNDVCEPKSKNGIRKRIYFLYLVWDYSPRLTEPLLEQPFNCDKADVLGEIQYDNVSMANKTPPIPEEIFGPLMGAALDYVLKYSTTLLDAWLALSTAWDTNIKSATIGPSGKEKRLSKAASAILPNYPTPWLKEQMLTRRVLYKELYRLRSACILVILAFSGIRSSELFAIEEKCCVYDELDDGQIVHYLNTTLHKHRHRGVKDTWVIDEDVVQAIKLLETLTKDARKALGTKRLLISSGENQFFNVMDIHNTSKYIEFNNCALLEAISEFQRHIGENMCRAPIPLWTNNDGKQEPWKFNTRQFRRTLAMYIALQPFGILALMRQYHHKQIVSSEAYAFRDMELSDMIDEECANTRMHFMEEFAISLSNGTVAGGAGLEIRADFENTFKGRAEDFPPSEIAKWLASSQKTLFIGKFNFCFFEPSQARCLRRRENKERPTINSCDPANWDNACVTEKHLPLWTAQLNQVQDAIRNPSTSINAKHVLQEEAVRLQKVIEGVKG